MSVSISVSATQNSQNIANNTSNVTVTVTANWNYGSNNRTGECYGSITIDGTKYSFSGIVFNSSITTNGSQTIMTKTVDVRHSSDGTKTLQYSASFYTGLSSSGTQSASGSKVLTTIPRKSTLSTSNGTLGTAQTISVTRQSSSFTHTITYTCGSASGTICTKSTSTSISWTPPLTLASQNVTGTSITVSLKIETFNGSTSLGYNTYSITCAIPASVKPSCSVSVSDPTGYDSTFGGYVQGRSKMQIAVTYTDAYDSALKSKKITADGKTYYADTTTPVISSSSNITVSATVTDNRGRTSNAATSTVSVLPYTAPQISSLAVQRCNRDGTENSNGSYAKVTYSFAITSLSSKNSKTITLKYKKSSESSWTTDTLTSVYTTSGSTYIFAADDGSSYDVVLSVTDSFEEVTRSTSVSTASVIMHFPSSGNGMAVGKVSEIENAFESAWPIYGNLKADLLLKSTASDETEFNTYLEQIFSTMPDYSCRTISWRCTAVSPAYPFGILSRTDSGYGVLISFTYSNGLIFFKRRTSAGWQSSAAYSFNNYLPLAGGTMTGRIQGSSISSFWYNARDGASLRTRFNNGASASSYYPSLSMKTPNGSWDIGTFNDRLYFNYVTDTDYNAGTNKVTGCVAFDTNNQILSAKLAWSDVINKPSFAFTSLYSGSTRGAINITLSSYDFLIVIGRFGSSSTGAHSCVVCPCPATGLYYQFTDDSYYYKFQLTTSGISAVTAGQGYIIRVYGVNVV